MITAPLTGHLDAALTEFAKRFQQNGLVSDQIAPRVLVGRQSDKYYIFGREAQQLTEKTLRASGAPAQRTRLSLSTASYFCRSHALGADIADEDRMGYEPGDLEQDAITNIIQKILLDKEDALATMLTDTAQVTNNSTLAGANQWSDLVNSDPQKDVEVGKSKIRESGVEATHLVIGEAVYTKLIQHPAVKEAFKYTTPGAMGVPQLASFFNVPNVLIARAVKVSAAGVPGFVWGKSVVLLNVSQTSSMSDISAVKSFVWRGAPGTIDGIGVTTGRNADPTAKSDIVGADFYYDQRITAVETAYLIKNAVA
jgi:hypothetical protein